MEKKNLHKIFLNIIRLAYIGEFSANDMIELIKTFLIDCRIKVRTPSQKLAAINFLTTDLSNFSEAETSPLALGLVYIKPDNTATQDFYVFRLNSNNYEYFKSDKKLRKHYPKLYGGHKKKFNITDFN